MQLFNTKEAQFTKIRKWNYASPEVNDFVFTSYTLGDVCNFKCVYCAEPSNGGIYGWNDPAHVKNFARQYKQQYSHKKNAIMLFSGGEPSLYPDWEEVADYTLEQGINISMLSNGSKPLKWWNEQTERLSSLMISFHPEYMVKRKDHIVEVANLLASNKIPVIICILLMPERFDELYDLAGWFYYMTDERFVSISPKYVRKWSDAYVPSYTNEQKEMVLNWPYFRVPENLLTSHRGFMKIESDTGDYTMPAPIIFPTDLNLGFKGWTCWAGPDSLFVDSDGLIYRGDCKAGGAIAHVSDKNIVFPTDPIICPKSKCNATSDLQTKKVNSKLERI